jgi:CHRD domain
MRKVLLFGLAALIGVLAISAVALADRGPGKNGNGKSFSARLNGWEEDPSQVTTGHGSFRLRIENNVWRFKLRWEDMEGPVAVAHIHIGSRSESGGVSAWLCGGGGQPPCEPSPDPTPADGEIEGTIVAANITGPANQGVEPGNVADLLRAVRRGETYTNVHSVPRAPGGEIRGQNRRGGGHGGKHRR